MTGEHGGPPWRWEIVNAGGEVVGSGEQWTHPLARPEFVAGERIAVVAYRMIRAGRCAEVADLVCRVWRPGERQRAEVSAKVWARRADTAAARIAGNA